MKFDKLTLLISKTYAERSIRRIDYFYADNTYHHGVFVDPFAEELIANLFECKSLDNREILFRHYLNELRLIPHRISLDIDLECYLRTNGRVTWRRDFPSYYEKFCEVRLGLYVFVMQVLLHQFEMHKVKIWKIIAEVYYPMDHIEHLMRNEFKEEFDLAYLEDFVHLKGRLGVEGIAILHCYLNKTITSDNCIPIIRFFGFESGKSLLTDYVNWLLPMNLRKGFESKVKFRNKILLLEKVAIILARNYPVQSEGAFYDCEILKEEMEKEFL